jgi:nitrate reductase alpha subunit
MYEALYQSLDSGTSVCSPQICGDAGGKSAYHFMTEVRYKGAKVISVAPDYAENVKFADHWLAPHPGTDAAVAQANFSHKMCVRCTC